MAELITVAVYVAVLVAIAAFLILIANIMLDVFTHKEWSPPAHYCEYKKPMGESVLVEHNIAYAELIASIERDREDTNTGR